MVYMGGTNTNLLIVAPVAQVSHIAGKLPRTGSLVNSSPNVDNHFLRNVQLLIGDL